MEEGTEIGSREGEDERRGGRRHGNGEDTRRRNIELRRIEDSAIVVIFRLVVALLHVQFHC